MDLESWVALGVSMKKTRHIIMDEMKQYNKSAMENRWLVSALNSIDKVRDKLDDLVFAQLCPKYEENIVAKIFYGPKVDVSQKREKPGRKPTQKSNEDMRKYWREQYQKRKLKRTIDSLSSSRSAAK